MTHTNIPCTWAMITCQCDKTDLHNVLEECVVVRYLYLLLNEDATIPWVSECIYNDVHSPPKVGQIWRRGIKSTCQMTLSDANCLNEWRSIVWTHLGTRKSRCQTRTGVNRGMHYDLDVCGATWTQIGAHWHVDLRSRYGPYLMLHKGRKL